MNNDGWIALHDAIKDTLLLKNGYVKHYWELTEDRRIEVAPEWWRKKCKSSLVTCSKTA